MDDYYGEEVATPAIEFVKVEPEYFDQLLDDMEIEDVKDSQRSVKVLPKVRPHTNPKIIKKKIMRVQYHRRNNNYTLKQNRLKPTVAKKATIPLSHELCVALIGRIKKEPCIWDSTSEHFKNKIMKNKAWDRVSAHLEQPVEILKAKWTSLLGSFRSYNSRYKKCREGKPSWFAFDLMSFLSNELESAHDRDTLSSAYPNAANNVPDTIINKPHNNRLPSPPEVIQEYVEETLLSSDSTPITTNTTAKSDEPKNVPDNSCNEEILRIVRSMSRVLNKMSNIGMSVDYGRYVNQHLKEYDDEIRRKTVKGILDLITAADEEMSLKYPDRSKEMGNECVNLQRK